MYRLSLEVYAWPFLLGYDCMSTYPLYLAGYSTYSLQKLVELGLGGFALLKLFNYVVASPLILVKGFAVFNQGLLGLSIYLWSAEKLQRKNLALLASLITSFYFATLRITWDLLAQTFGLSLLFITLWLSLRRSRLAYILVPLTAISHLTMAPLILAGLVPHLVKGTRNRILLLSTLTVAYLSAILLLPLVRVTPLALELMLYLSLPLIPFILLTLRGIPSDIGLMLLTSISLTCIGVAQTSAAAPFRFGMLTGSLMILSTAIGIFNRPHLTTRWKALTSGLMIVVMVFAIGYTAKTTYDPFPYFASPYLWNPRFLHYAPSSLMQNTVPIADSPSIVELLCLASQNTENKVMLLNVVTFAHMMVGNCYNGRVELLGKAGNLPVDPFVRARQLAANGLGSYTIWRRNSKEWAGVSVKEPLFHTLTTSGDFALYGFMYSVSGGGRWERHPEGLKANNIDTGGFVLTPLKVVNFTMNIPIEILQLHEDKHSRAGVVLWGSGSRFYYLGLSRQAQHTPYLEVAIGERYKAIRIIKRLTMEPTNTSLSYKLTVNTTGPGLISLDLADMRITIDDDTIASPWRVGFIAFNTIAVFDDKELVSTLYPNFETTM